jgi:6-pyruvoyltetrahydropterin/6-carboxytetrahydropterin synthase
VVEVVLRAQALDASDMVCDYKALKRVVAQTLDRFDHAMLLAAGDPLRDVFAPFAERVVLLEEGDPTTENIARHLFAAISRAFEAGTEVQGDDEVVYRVPEGVILERVRVWETPNTWAEYIGEP